ncbi:hypothetical protein HYS11_00085 [Candidatus Gottesmanbacteria bacterium]|nr:hypothetical protein [Candidatus Gottesmanbacteria bacterium]MBI3443750.1 hypothetical protein [Candidatus Woesebacteria bacterium]
MITPQVQIKLNLPLNLKEFAESKAGKFGITLASYVKHLILKDVEDMDYPTYAASERIERVAKKALKERHKAVRVTNVEEFFKNL